MLDLRKELHKVRYDQRKSRLYAAGCALRLSLWDSAYAAIECAKRYADNETEWERLYNARTMIFELPREATGVSQAVWVFGGGTAAETCSRICDPWSVVGSAVLCKTNDCEDNDRESVREVEWVFQNELFGCVFGGEKVFLKREWVEEGDDFANQIYNYGQWDRLPILADALEEAGCNEGSVLEHCRGDGPHTQGCWVVDKILGRLDACRIGM